MSLSTVERAVLRELAGQVAEIAGLPVHGQKAELWRRLNDLETVRPMVWINEEPWHELNVDDELTPRCQDTWARNIEMDLRRTLYKWRHLRCDMIVSGFISSPIVIRGAYFGIAEKSEILKTDAASGVVSRHFIPQLVEPEDVEKIQMPRLWLDEEATAVEFEKRSEIFSDILPVKKVGMKHHWFTPWDNLIRFWGVEQAMMDLVLRPEMVNAAVSRWVDASLSLVDQWEALNALELNNDNTRIGSGGYGYTRALPAPGFEAGRARSRDMWGCGNAQIFSEVSPAMHWEFALRHEMRFLQRWGMTYYGCCEPLHHKMDILRRIPNLRKVSMSPKADPARGAEELGRNYVFSFKPNPAILAEDTWRPRQARKELREALDKARGCNVEIIMKDISTVRYEPRRLWEWAEMAMQVAEEFAP